MQVLVGYTCRRHSVQGFVDEAFIDDVDNRHGGSDESDAGKALDKREDRLKATDFEAAEGITIDAAIDSPLRSQLLARFQKVLDTDEQFIPAGDFDEVLTHRAIETELQSLGLDKISSYVFRPSYVFRRAKKIFAILLVIRKLDALQGLIEEALGDEVLPLLDSARVLSEWDLDTRRQFLEVQWTLLAPVFSEGQHLKLDDDVRLPFIRTESIANGAYGSVHCVAIHGDHENFENFGTGQSQKGNMYALKQFGRGTADVNKQAFERELAVLSSVHSSGHSHIIKHLASFEQRGRYSVILPLAKHDLRQFWAHVSPATVASHWCLEQITGLATALSYLHNDLLAQDSRPMSGWHMDLKPENILVMTDTSSSGWVWKISDFGSSFLHPKGSVQELPPHPGLGTYEPPECQLDLPQSQAYDIWSLGCIFMECAAWLMRGSDAIDAFAEERLNDVEISGNIFKDDYFFTLKFDESLTPVGAITRPAVTKWIRDLELDQNCDEAISGLLHLIKDVLLQVDQNKRLKADLLGQRLELIYNAAKRIFDAGPRSKLRERKLIL